MTPVVPPLPPGLFERAYAAAGEKRLWLARLDVGTAVLDYAYAHSRPIRYTHVARDWPLGAYETIFAREPGSAEMPSASRPFTDTVVTDLVARGVLVTPLVLHTGVSSLEGGEPPYPERYRVPRASAATVSSSRAVMVRSSVADGIARSRRRRNVATPVT